MRIVSIKRHTIACAFALASMAVVIVGCDDSNRVPSKEEGAAADVKRQAFIDKLNIPEDQKARMKAQMGGPPVASPADAAKAAAGKKTPDNSR